MPVAVAFSGGGDSLALLLAAKSWADENGRQLIAMTVDHGLHPSSPDWVRWCQERAASAGIEHRALEWLGGKDRGNLTVRARAARHRLLADCAREFGAHVLLLGHTRDDLLEAQLMRAAGGRVGDALEWSPSPVWPQGRGQFLLRPLLGVRRSWIRSFLVEASQSWIEDPANEDLRSARVRARRAVAAAAITRGQEAGTLSWRRPTTLLQAARLGEAAEIAVTRQAIANANSAEVRAFLGAALLCASGTSRPPRATRLARLALRLESRERFTAGLAGARIEADDRQVRIMREPGELTRRPLASLADNVWDGRFEFHAKNPAVEIRPLSCLLGRLAPAERRRLAAAPAAARRALPAMMLTNGKAICPMLAGEGPARAKPLVMARLAGALGAIETESDCEAMARDHRTS